MFGLKNGWKYLEMSGNDRPYLENGCNYLESVWRCLRKNQPVLLFGETSCVPLASARAHAVT